MEKILGYIVIGLFLCTGTAFSRTQTLVDKGEWGTGYYYSAATKDNIAYVITGLNKLDVFDATDRNNLVKLSDVTSSCNFDFSFGTISISGNVMAVACPFSIGFYDISNASTPIFISSYQSLGYAVNGILLDGDRLYMVGGNSDVLVFDSSDLSNLVELGRNTVGSYNSGMEIKKFGNYIYFTELSEQIGIYDISDPTNIVTASQYSLPNSFYRDTEVVGNYLYISYSNGIQVVDISDPDNATFVRNITLDTDGNLINSSGSLYFDSTTLFLGTSDGNIRTISLTTADIPVVSPPFSISTSNINDLAGFIDSLVISNNDDGIKLVDITDLNNLTSQGSYTESITPGLVSISGDKISIGGLSSLVHLFEFGVDDLITEVVRIHEVGFSKSPVIKENILWTDFANTLKSFSVLDISNPLNFDDLTLGDGNFTNANISKEINDILYVGLNDGIVEMYDVSGATPVEVMEFGLGVNPVNSTTRSIIDIERNGDYLYISTRQDDLVVLDISDLNIPVEIFAVDWTSFEGEDRQLAIFGDYLYIARNIGLMLVDIQDPTTPNYIGVSTDYGLLDSIQKIDATTGIIGNDSSEIVLLNFPGTGAAFEIHRLSTPSRIDNLAYNTGRVVATNTNKSIVKIIRINEGPVAQSQVETIDEDLVLNSTLMVTDNENDQLTFTITTQPVSGTVTINSDTSFVYTPSQDFFGNDSFSYEVFDEPGSSATETVSITVNSVNDIPVVTTTSISVVEDTIAIVQLEATDVEDEVLTYSLVNPPASGTLDLSSTGEVTYTPLSNFFGSVSFDVKANDGTDDSDIQVIQIDISSVNDKPVVTSTNFDALEDVVLLAQLEATDVENDTLTYAVVNAPASGVLVVTSAGEITYTPEANVFGSITFDVKANDTSDDSDVVTITIDIAAVNDSPVVDANQFDTDEDAMLSASVTASDVDGQPLTFTLVEDVSNGQITLATDGTFEYIPNDDFNGSDSFQVLANDGVVNSAVVALTINIAAVNDIPVVNDASFETDEDTLKTGQLAGTDVESQTLTFVLSSEPVNGQLTLNEDGSFEYTPDANFNGTDGFQVKANDGTDDGEDKTIEISINAINDSPTTQNQSASVQQNASLTRTLNASDVDGETLIFSVDSNVTNGSLSLSTGGSFTYTPSAGFTGSDSFSFSVSDPSGETATAQMNITVTPTPSSGGGGPVGWLFLLLVLAAARLRSYK